MNKKTDKAEIERQVAEQKAWLATLSTKVSELKTENDLWKKENKYIEEERAHLNADFDKFKAQVQAVGDDVERLNQERDSLSKAITELGGERTKIDRELSLAKDELTSTLALLEKTKKDNETLYASNNAKLEEFRKREEILKMNYDNLRNYELELESKASQLNKRELLLRQ